MGRRKKLKAGPLAGAVAVLLVSSLAITHWQISLCVLAIVILFVIAGKSKRTTSHRVRQTTQTGGSSSTDMSLRESRRRQKEIDREEKESAKLTAIKEAQVKVAEAEKSIEALYSIHRQSPPAMDWRSLASSLEPHEPLDFGRHKSGTTPRRMDRNSAGSAIGPNAEVDPAEDSAEENTRRKCWLEECSQSQRRRELARRVLAGELGAYEQAILESPGLVGLRDLTTSFGATAHSRRLVECRVNLHGRDVFPKEAPSLTSTGKVTVKAIPRTRFHELYQDHVCSYVLRIAREVIALLPIDTVLVTASVPATDTYSASGIPVLSIAMSRSKIEELDFERLDPSDAIEYFLRRGDVRASRRSGEFLPIVPLLPNEVDAGSAEEIDLKTMLMNAHQLREEIIAMRATLT
jgi:hypothetical protein